MSIEVVWTEALCNSVFRAPIRNFTKDSYFTNEFGFELKLT